MIAVYLGVREGGLLGLSWKDINFEESILKINYSLQRVEGNLRLVEPKTEKSKRFLPLPAHVLAVIRKHKAMQLQEKMRLGEAWHNKFDLVFTTEIGTQIEARNLIRSFKAILQKADLPNICFHVLRHTAATMLLLKGTPLRLIMDVLGHSQIALTANLYTHTDNPKLREALNNLGDLKEEGMRKITTLTR